MATKVKGEAIKEGSIPLSALSNEVKDKIENAGGADWNAQKGDAGYIENKPFKEERVNGYLFEVSNDPLVRSIHYRINNSVPLDVDSIKIHYEDSGIVFVDKTIDLNESLPQYTYIENVSESPIGSFGISLYNDGGIFEVVVAAGDELFAIIAESTLQSGVISVEKINYLDEKYISNTVVKTTPQTLSDTDKNQALANLGIDNTKYILSIAPSNTFNIREFIDKFGFIAELNDDGYGGYIGDLIVTNKELFLDKVLCCGFNTSLAKCIYVNNSAEVVFFFEEGLAKGSVKVGFAENDMNSEPTMIGWEPLG